LNGAQVQQNTENSMFQPINANAPVAGKNYENQQVQVEAENAANAAGSEQRAGAQNIANNDIGGIQSSGADAGIKFPVPGSDNNISPFAGEGANASSAQLHEIKSKGGSFENAIDPKAVQRATKNLNSSLVEENLNKAVDAKTGGNSSVANLGNEIAQKSSGNVSLLNTTIGKISQTPKNEINSPSGNSTYLKSGNETYTKSDNNSNSTFGNNTNSKTGNNTDSNSTVTGNDSQTNSTEGTENNLDESEENGGTDISGNRTSSGSAPGMPPNRSSNSSNTINNSDDEEEEEEKVGAEEEVVVEDKYEEEIPDYDNENSTTVINS